MYYINEETLEYPITEAYIKALYPNTSFSSPFIPPEPFVSVKFGNTPVHNSETQRIVEVGPVKESDGWRRSWKVENLSEEEIQRVNQIKKERIVKELFTCVQSRLDAFAKTKNYDNILSACTYATSNVEKFRLEGQYCVEARDLTWMKFFEILSDIDSGVKSLPESYQEIASELPVLEWPSAPT